MKKILVLGAAGYIGSYLYEFLSSNSDCVLSGVFRVKGISFIVDRNGISHLSLKDYIVENKIECIILSTGSASVDKSEIDVDFSYKRNYLEPVNYIKQAIEINPCIQIVLLSSIYVYGKNSTSLGFVEDDPISPQSVYGRDKAKLERFVQDNVNKYIIARLPMVIGNVKNSSDYIRSTMEKIASNSLIEVDQGVRFPTDINWISSILVALIKSDFNGLIHVSSQEGISKRELVNYISNKITGYEYYQVILLNRTWKRPDFLKLTSNILPRNLYCEISLFNAVDIAINKLEKKIY
jgi:dTDP-4-dehydrorhamnose reductase